MKRSFKEGVRVEGFREQRFEGLVFGPFFEDFPFKELDSIFPECEGGLNESGQYLFSEIWFFPGASNPDELVEDQVKLLVVFVVGGRLRGEFGAKVFEEGFEVFLSGEVDFEL